MVIALPLVVVLLVVGVILAGVCGMIFGFFCGTCVFFPNFFKDCLCLFCLFYPFLLVIGAIFGFCGGLGHMFLLSVQGIEFYILAIGSLLCSEE